MGEGSMALGVTPLSWAQWLARALDLPFTAYAVNGATAAAVRREQLPRVRADYDVATLYVGVNDVRSGDWDPAAYERDLDAVAAGLAEHAERLLLLTLPHDLGRPTSAPKPIACNAIIADVAARRGATVADLRDFGGWTLAAGTLPSALTGARGHANARYAPTHARMLWHDLVRRGVERLRRP